ncbi:MAG: hypothetical protein ACREOE_13865, partial [Gemmatimonadales bacterium]
MSKACPRVETGDPGIAGRGFPSREAAAAKIAAGKHFAWRVSPAWKLPRCGRPLPDGAWKTTITWQRRTARVRVTGYHMDQVFGLPPGHPLLAPRRPARPPGSWTTAGRAGGRTAPTTGRHHPRG